MTGRARATLFAAACALAACGGARSAAEDDRQAARSERVIACETALNELSALDTDTATEAQLVAAMEHADAMQPVCAEAFASEATNEAERVMAQHFADQFTLNALFIEATLSIRFDGSAHYCDIVTDTLNLLLRDLTTIEVALRGTGLSSQERAQLVELRDLDAEAVDVLVVANDRLCR